jgi:hypothetical protein
LISRLAKVYQGYSVVKQGAFNKHITWGLLAVGYSPITHGLWPFKDGHSTHHSVGRTWGYPDIMGILGRGRLITII